MSVIDRPRARAMMAESEDALRPALERVREIVPHAVWLQYEEGLIAGAVLLLFMFAELNPPDDHCMTEADHPHD